MQLACKDLRLHRGRHNKVVSTHFGRRAIKVTWKLCTGARCEHVSLWLTNVDKKAKH